MQTWFSSGFGWIIASNSMPGVIDGSQRTNSRAGSCASMGPRSARGSRSMADRMSRVSGKASSAERLGSTSTKTCRSSASRFVCTAAIGSVRDRWLGAHGRVRLFLFFAPLLVFTVAEWPGSSLRFRDRRRSRSRHRRFRRSGRTDPHLRSTVARGATRWFAVLLGLLGMITAGRSLSKALWAWRARRGGYHEERGKPLPGDRRAARSGVRGRSHHGVGEPVAASRQAVCAGIGVCSSACSSSISA